MRDPDGERFEDLVGAHALGVLDGHEERRAFRELLLRRPDLRRETEKLHRTADLLAFAGPFHEPPEELGRRILLGVLEFEAAPVGTRPALILRRAKTRWRLSGRQALVGVAAVACAGVLLAARLRRTRPVPGVSRASPSWPARVATPAGCLRMLEAAFGGERGTAVLPQRPTGAFRPRAALGFVFEAARA